MEKFEVYRSTSKDGGFRWRLRGRDGEIVAIGQRHATKADCEKSITYIKRAAAKAEVASI